MKNMHMMGVRHRLFKSRLLRNFLVLCIGIVSAGGPDVLLAKMDAAFLDAHVDRGVVLGRLRMAYCHTSGAARRQQRNTSSNKWAASCISGHRRVDPILVHSITWYLRTYTRVAPPASALAAGRRRPGPAAACRSTRGIGRQAANASSASLPSFFSRRR